MEKLIELLNEREKELSPSVQVEWTEFSVGISKRYLISKECWFIKRLVDNVKIDRDKVIRKSDFRPIVKNKFWDLLNPTDERELLMLLSISDTPIEDLISYLR